MTAYWLAFLALNPRALICVQNRRRITLPEPARSTKRFRRKSEREYEALASRRSQFGNTYRNNYS
jgi:hypothetical protein